MKHVYYCVTVMWSERRICRWSLEPESGNHSQLCCPVHSNGIVEVATSRSVS